MNKPFDNDILRTKTVWTDEELRKEIDLLQNAEAVLQQLGDRYDVVRSDIIQKLNIRESMAFARGWRY